MCECAICLDIPDVAERLEVCGHEYCVECITDWWTTCEKKRLPKRCPLCTTLVSHPSTDLVIQELCLHIQGIIKSSLARKESHVLLDTWMMCVMSEDALSVNIVPKHLREKYSITCDWCVDSHMYCFSTKPTFLEKEEFRSCLRALTPWIQKK